MVPCKVFSSASHMKAATSHLGLLLTLRAAIFTSKHI